MNQVFQQQVHEMLGTLFDPKAELFIEDRMRPHWTQAGAVVFITMRTRDSIPADVINLWERQKHDWLVRRGHHADVHWSILLPALAQPEQHAFKKEFNRCREEFLDSCHGECVLR